MDAEALGLLAGLLGGVGLFLLGMELMTDGLRLAAGPSLERLLAASTATRWRGLLAGVLVTALVQSSSAVTVATIGFVNAGLLTLGGALWVLFGANVGTTMTGWIVAVLGFGVKIDALALPLVGLGVGLRLTGAGSRRAALGTALAGFGLLFFGIEVLKDAFGGVAQRIELPAGTGWTAVLAQLLIGLVLTILMQSSSASLTVTLSAAQAGLIGAQGAAAVVIGANIGTTVTAVIAALGATANARRAASAHVLFNVLTGLVALALLPWLVDALLRLKQALGMPAAPALTVALFHTVFNVLGVLLMWPLGDRLAAWLQQQFRAAEEDEARPRYLDPTVLSVPVLALDALRRELVRLRMLAARSLRTVVDLPAWGVTAQADEAQARQRLATAHGVAHRLAQAVGDFIVRLQRAEMSRDSAEHLPDLMRAARYAEVAVEQAQEAAEALAPWSAPEPGLPLLELAALRQRALALLVPLEQAPGLDAQAVEAALAEAEDAYAVLKAALLRLGAQGAVPLATMDAWLRACSELRRGLQQIAKAQRLLAPLAPAPAG
ncbi:Na/Pi-cotransporter II-related protein [Tepidimonas thermarum]|uniref:Na/Pi-cotransporter II-related protein n=1 Tax=Tepidimonas thermarum TaxID=335431 RepID=A0A554X275_9BURK|nr:Na/Pi symporter [Tepidimonas thermarum]TSE29866.1 Na/Pi-cotransporter II-related protein [Tepidimonas thermarum]